MEEEGEEGRSTKRDAAVSSSPETPREAAVEEGTNHPETQGGSTVRDPRPGAQQVEATAGVNETTKDDAKQAARGTETCRRTNGPELPKVCGIGVHRDTTAGGPSSALGSGPSGVQSEPDGVTDGFQSFQNLGCPSMGSTYPPYSQGSFNSMGIPLPGFRGTETLKGSESGSRFGTASQATPYGSTDGGFQAVLTAGVQFPGGIPILQNFPGYGFWPSHQPIYGSPAGFTAPNQGYGPYPPPPYTNLYQISPIDFFYARAQPPTGPPVMPVVHTLPSGTQPQGEAASLDRHPLASSEYTSTETNEEQPAKGSASRHPSSSSSSRSSILSTASANSYCTNPRGDTETFFSRNTDTWPCCQQRLCRCPQPTPIPISPYGYTESVSTETSAQEGSIGALRTAPIPAPRTKNSAPRPLVQVFAGFEDEEPSLPLHGNAPNGDGNRENGTPDEVLNPVDDHAVEEHQVEENGTENVTGSEDGATGNGPQRPRQNPKFPYRKITYRASTKKGTGKLTVEQALERRRPELESMLSELKALMTLLDEYLDTCQALQVSTDLGHLVDGEAAFTNYEHLQTLGHQLTYIVELENRITAQNSRIHTFISRAPVNARSPETQVHQEYVDGCQLLTKDAHNIRARIQTQISKAQTYDEFVKRQMLAGSPRRAPTTTSPVNWDAPMGSQGQTAHTAGQAAQRANAYMQAQIGTVQDNTVVAPQARPSGSEMATSRTTDPNVIPLSWTTTATTAQAPRTQISQNRHFLEPVVTSSRGSAGAAGSIPAPAHSTFDPRVPPPGAPAVQLFATPPVAPSAPPRPLDVQSTNRSTETTQLANLITAQQKALSQQGDMLAKLAGAFQNQNATLQTQMTNFTETIATNVQNSQTALLRTVHELTAGLKSTETAGSSSSTTTESVTTTAPPPRTILRADGSNRNAFRDSGASNGSMPLDGADFGGGVHRPLMDAMMGSNRTENTYKIAPKEPKQFENSYTDWPRFWEEFSNFISQTNLDTMSQVRLLKRCLNGEALQAVGYLSETSDDYETMIRTLKRRYDQPDLMLQSYITEIQNVKPAVRDPPDPKEQRRFYDQSFALLQRVKRCGMDINHMTVRQTLLAKLSPKAQEHVLQALARLGLEEQSTEKVLETLEEFVRHLERSPALTEIHRKFNRSATPVPAPTHRTYAAVCKGGCGSRSGSEADSERFTEMEHVNAAYQPPGGSRDRRSYPSKPMGRGPDSRQRRRPDRCMFCQKRGHTSMRCEQYQTLRQRQDRLRERKMCARCTKKDHTENVCQRQLGQCVGCSRRGDHIALLCPEQISQMIRAAEGRFPRREAPRPKTYSQQTYEVRELQGFHSREGSPECSEGGYSSRTDCEGVDFSDSDSVYGIAARKAEEETHVHMAGADERTVLQCVQAKVTNPETHTSATVRIFLDSGSSQTFIDRSLAKRMGLRLGPAHPTTVLTFGGKRTNVNLYSTKFCLVLRDESRVVVQAEATDELTAYMPMVEPSEVEEVLLHPEKPVTIIKGRPDILLGLDYHHVLKVTLQGSKMENGFCAYDTEVGPIIAGQGKVANPEIIKPRAHFCFRTQPQHVEAKIAKTQVEADQVEAKRPNASWCTETDSPKVSTETSGPKASELLTLAEKILSLEGLGIKPEEVTCNEEYVLENFRKNLTRLPDGRYEVRFPWLSQILEMVEVIRKSSAPKNELTWDSVLPTNKRGATARLKSVWPELAKNPESLEQFNDNFVTLLDRDMMEDVPTEGVEDHLVHYVPTGPVWREDKPTKLRVVLDASARADRGSRCLNDCLHPGPSLLENLVGIQLRSRLHPILLLGDVEKAFLQLSLAEEDRDVTRVLWLKDYKKPPSTENIRELRYKRVPFGISSSPFLLFATIRHHLEASGSQYAEEYARNMYSDNLFLFADSQEEAFTKYTETKKIFTEMKMNIREFLSNDGSVMQRIPEVDRAKETKEKTLGLAWSPAEGAADYWELKLPNPRVVATATQENTDGTETKRVPRKKRRDRYTKRFVISVINKLFDPKGMACPTTLQARLVYQDTWEDQSKKWDDELSEDLIQKWIKATETWIEATEIKIPRYLFQGIQKAFEVEMHIFTDASKDACGAAYYLLARDSGGRTVCRLIFGKNYVRKNKPKALTIPRLELTAVLIGCRCLKLLRTEMFPELRKLTGQTTIPVTSWCDNQGVLYWIRNSSQIYGTFVQNRLTEIRRHASEGVQFLFVGTKDNPSDLASRGCTPNELRHSSLWWEGPKWLLKKEDWPAQPAEEGFQPFAEDELGPDSIAPRPEKLMVNAVSKDLVIGQTVSDLYGLVSEQIPPAKRNFARVKRVTAWVVRIARAIMFRAKNRAPRHPLVRKFEADATKWSRTIQLHEYHLAEKMLLWSTQQSSRPTETHVQQFGLKEDPEGLLRLHDRLRNAALPERTKFALWLPPRTKFTTEIVRGIHLDNQHAPQETVLGLLRDRYWLVDARRQIASVLRKTCVGCRVIKGPAFEQKPFADFPEGRVKPCRPFARIGVDFFGPFKRREGDRERRLAKGRKARKSTETSEDPPDVKKLWGCIFTCMATRAVFLQTMEDQTAECFLMAFQTFTSHYGLPSMVISDNAPTFLLTAQTLEEVWKACLVDPETAQHFRETKVEWRTITPYAPWQGGFYERLIQNVKTCLKASIGQRILKLSAYNLLFAQISQTLNHRPLTFHRNVPGFRPLRPVDFLRPLAGHQADLQPLEDLEDEAWIPKETSAQRLVKTWQFLEARHNDFWKRWRSEYLLSLRAKARTVTNSGAVTRAPRVGEYVFVEDMSNVPRPLWKFARIKELVPDRDGVIRNAWLVIPGGTEILRAIHKLYPLELGDPEDPSATLIAERVREYETPASTENPVRSPTRSVGGRRQRKNTRTEEPPLLRRNPMRRVRFQGLPESDQSCTDGDEDGVL